jgi:hypothetical protein
MQLCGFWFLDSPASYVPPKDLLDFIEAGIYPSYIYLYYYSLQCGFNICFLLPFLLHRTTTHLHWIW